MFMANVNTVQFNGKSNQRIIANDAASAIKALRNSLGISQSELAAKAHINASIISKVEHGKIRPTVDWLNRIAESVGYIVKVEFSNDGGNQNENK